MSLKNLTKNLENFKWTNYSNVGENSAPPSNGGNLNSPNTTWPPPSNGGNLEPPEPIKDQKKKLVYTGPPIPKSTKEIEKTIPPIKDVNLSKTMSIIDKDIKNPMNLSQIKGRHGGTKDGGLPPHPEEHSLYDDGAGENLSQISGRHGGTEPLGQPPHLEEHSLLDDGAGVPQLSNDLITLTKDLVNFKWTNYDNVGDNLSQIGGHHGGTLPGGQPPHSLDHSEFDDGAGTPQSFYDGHSQVVTGQKTFERPNPKSLADMKSKFGPLNTQPLERGPYGVTDYMDGTKQGRGFIPPGGHPLGFTVDMGVSKYAIGDPLDYTLTPLSHTIASVNSGGPHGSVPEQTLNISPVAPNAWAEDFMTTPLAEYESQYSEPVDSVTHQVDMITLTGPTVPDDDHYLNVTPKVDNAHGSDFMTLPISGYPGLYVGSQGDIVPIIPSVIGLGASDSIAASWPDKIFHQLGNLQDEKLYDVYQHHFLPTIENFNHVSLLTDLFENESTSVAAEKWRDGSIHIGLQDIAAPVGGSVTSWANIMPVTPRYSMFRDAQGNYQVPTLFPHEWTNQPTFNILGGYPESTYGSGYTINSQFGYSWTEPHSSTHGAHSFEIGDINIDLYESMPKYHLDTPLTIKWHLTNQNIEEWPYKQFGFSNSPENAFNEGSLGITTSTGALVFATQPFIRRQVGQGYLDGRGTGVVGADHLATVIARIEEDTTRINAWLNTPAGKNWHNNQYTLQNLNPRPETRTYNPGSLLISLVPHLHGQRHLSGFFGIFGPGKYGDLQTDMDYQEEGPGWDGKDTAGIWGYGTREAGSFDIGEKNRLTGLTAQFIGGAEPKQWKHLFNLFPSWDGGFWSAISGMENWSATNRGRTPEKPEQVVFSQKGAYEAGQSSAGGIYENLGGIGWTYSPARYSSLAKGHPSWHWLYGRAPRSSDAAGYITLPYGSLNTGAAYTKILGKDWDKLRGDENFQSKAYVLESGKLVHQKKSDSAIIKFSWRFLNLKSTNDDGTEKYSGKDDYFEGLDEYEKPVHGLDERVFPSHFNNEWFQEAVTEIANDHSDQPDGNAKAQVGLSWLSTNLGATNPKASHPIPNKWFKTKPYHKLGPVESYVTSYGEWHSPLVMGWAYLDPIGFDASDIRYRDGSSAGPWTPKWARFKVEKNNFELKSKNLLYYGSATTRPDPGTISFTIGKDSHGNLNPRMAQFWEEEANPLGKITRTRVFTSVSNTEKVSFETTVKMLKNGKWSIGHGTAPRSSADINFLVLPYQGLDIETSYGNDLGRNPWPIDDDRIYFSSLIKHSWRFFDKSHKDKKDPYWDDFKPVNSAVEGVSEQIKHEFEDTVGNLIDSGKVFTINKRAAKGLGPDGIPSGDLLKQYSTLVYGNLNLQSAYDSNKDGLGALLSPSEFNLTDIPKIPALTKEMAERKIGQNIRKDIGEPGTTGVGPVTDTVLGVIKKGIDNSKHTSITQDKVNLIPYGEDYTAVGTDVAKKTSDFIKFKFFDVVNNKFIVFRALLSGVSDSITPEWTGTRYIGRPDQVYVYNGAERKVSFTFDVYPKTKQELPVLWEKLNYLVGLCYPSYQDSRMVAPFINLTIGDMFVGTPGFLDSLSVEVNDLSTWEIQEGLQFPKHITCQCSFTYIGKHLHTGGPLGKHYGFMDNIPAPVPVEQAAVTTTVDPVEEIVPLTFGDVFNAEKANGEKTFTYNGTLYNTMTAEEKAAGKTTWNPTTKSWGQPASQGADESIDWGPAQGM